MPTGVLSLAVYHSRGGYGDDVCFIAAISRPIDFFCQLFAMLPSVILVLSASDLPAAQPIQFAPVSSASSTVVLFAHDLSDAYHRSAF